MPYVGEEDRIVSETKLKAHGTQAQLGSAGCLNFVISKLCDNFIGHAPSYDKINAVIGALECAKQELYRRLAAPYEDRKCSENGDIYTSEFRWREGP